MIAAIRGHVIEYSHDKLYIETSAGIIYEVLASPRALTLFSDSSDVLVYTSMIVRENEMYLAGFESLNEKKLFEILITAKGIGPKQALKILGSLTPSDLRLSIVSGDAATLARIKGVGTKKAEQLILDLKGKLSIDTTEDLSSNESTDARKKTEILLTMRALGYSDNEIKKSLDVFFDQCDTALSVENLVALFLRSLK